MIKWLLPLGLLGLLSILGLILIYIIKPNLQQKFLSSTYIWRVMLKKRKRKVPIQPIKNVLIFLFQVLALTLLSLILAEPKLFTEGFVNDDTERIVILDASANMRAKFAGDETSPTRFERAVKEVKLHIDEWLITNEGTLSVILAGKEAGYVVSGATSENYSAVVTALDGLECSFGTADMQGALLLAEQRLAVNPAAQVILYSGSDYGNLGTAVTVRSLANISNEWNVGVLNCAAAIEGNEYVFHVTVGAFGRISEKFLLTAEFSGADFGDEEKNSLVLQKEITVDVNSDSSEYSLVQYVDFRASDPEVGGSEDWYCTAFEQVKIGFSALRDSMPEDDVFLVYGGKRESVRVEYYSTEPNIFYYLSFHYLRDPMRKTYDISYRQAYGRSEVEFEGYEFYVFEHTSFSEYPTDGVLILSDPNDLSGFGIQMGGEQSFGALQYFTSPAPHPLTQYLTVEKMGATAYNKITSFPPEFEPVLYCNGDPVLLVKTVGQPVVVMPFSLNRSNLPASTHLTELVFNLIKTYLPQMLETYSFEVDETATVLNQNNSVTVLNPQGESQALTEFPAEVILSELGTYTFSTEYDYDRPARESKAFVHIAPDESGLFRMIALNIRLDTVEAWKELGISLFMYLAIALLVVSTAEWALQCKEIV